MALHFQNLSLAPLSKRNETLEPTTTTPVFPEPATRRIIQYLTKRQVFNMRLVCKGWKKSVDETAQNAPTRVRDLITTDRFNLSCLFQQRFKSEFQINRFLKAMGSTTVNPFPGRSVVLRDVNWFGAKLLLWKFGPQVWHLQIVSTMKGSEIGKYVEENLSNIRHIFMYLINLKTLVIKGLNMPEEGGLVNVRLVADLYSNPFPSLANLESFDVWNTSAPLLVNGIIKASKNLKRLIVSKHVFDFNTELPRLEYLKVGIFEISDFDSLKNLKCPVKTVELNYSQISEEPGLILVNWLSGLKQYSETLERVLLMVEVCASKLGDPMGKWVTLDFPRLETLNIDYYPEASLSFLPTLPGLKNLYITTTTEDAGEMVREELYDKNHEIWERMPNLDIIRHDDSEEMMGSDSEEEWPEMTVAKRGVGVCDWF